MFQLYFLLSVCLSLMLQVSRACDEENQLIRYQQSDEYLASAYEFNPNLGMFHPMAYYESGARVPEFYASPYEGRTPFTKRPTIQSFKKQLNNADEENNQAEGRFVLGSLGANLINTGLFNNRFTPANTWRPFQNLANRIPVSYNPNFNNRPINAFDACTSFSGDTGICAPGNICSLFGGRPRGSCVLGKVCCINAITTCGGTVTLNNTYWQSPSTAVSAPSTCALTVRMDTKLVEQFSKPICQIRLDFVSFTTTQPTAGTCTDTFTVGGSTSSVPIICGDNAGQHMYLDVPSSATTSNDVQLIFNFATGTTATRSWNIKIAMLPCGASYLAPADCLQYFTAATGRVRSFNWQDVAGSATRQLNDQNYNICFRTELVPSQRAIQICLSVCTVTSGGDAFSITTPTSTDAAKSAAAVDNAKAILAPLELVLANEEAALLLAKEDLKVKDDAVAKAEAAYLIAQNGGDPEAVIAAEAAVTTANNEQIAATTAVNNKKADVATAQIPVTAAQAELTAAQITAANDASTAGALSGMGSSAIVNEINTATCLYDYLLIAGARDSTNVVADRFCGNALNPAATPVAASVPVCTPIKLFRMTYQTDSTEGEVAAGTNILPAPADTANTGFCLDYQEK